MPRRRPDLNAVITAVHQRAAGVTADTPLHRPTLEQQMRWWASKQGRVPIISEDAIDPLVTPAARAARIAMMRAQLLEELLTLLRRRQV